MLHSALHTWERRSWLAAGSLALAVVLFTWGPITAALAIHHQLAAADHDGHQHSNFDLCHWVQKHASGSLALDAPNFEALWQEVTSQTILEPLLLISSLLISTSSPRGPPLS